MRVRGLGTDSKRWIVVRGPGEFCVWIEAHTKSPMFVCNEKKATGLKA